MQYTDRVTRLRAGRIVDPYDPDASVEDWGSPVVVEVDGFFDQSFESTGAGEVREQVTGRATLYLPPGADVAAGDRVVFEGVTWAVTGAPLAPRNPFTGWRPVRSVQLEEVSG